MPSHDIHGWIVLQIKRALVQVPSVRRYVGEKHGTLAELQRLQRENAALLAERDTLSGLVQRLQASQLQAGPPDRCTAEQAPPVEGARHPEPRSNVQFWKQMQEDRYFENHPCYHGLVDMDAADCAMIEWFLPLSKQMNAVVIGCGYGRETLHIAPRVAHVFGIDVSPTILEKAVTWLRERGVANFTPVQAEAYGEAIPDGIDLVFSIVVMQHLTRDLVADYFAVLGAKLNPQGRMVVQFLEEIGTEHQSEAELRLYEPSVSWSVPEIARLCRESGLRLEMARSYLATDTALWHWICAAPAAHAGHAADARPPQEG